MSVIDYSWDFKKEDFSLDLDFFNEKEQEDKLWQARTGLDKDTVCGAIETIIFMSDSPVSLQKIKNTIDPDLPLRIIHESIAVLQQDYETKQHGIRLMEVAQGYQFRTKPTFAKYIQKMFKVTELQLSPTALEVLAIIAYKQPVSKTDVENIRGVDSSHIIRALMDKRLVKIVGRSEEMGRPSLFGTSTEFLEVFNLSDIDQLPSESELDEIASANEIGEISDIKNIVNTGDKKRFEFDELEELDQLSSSIKSIDSDTLFTKSLKAMDVKRKTDDGVERKSAFDILEEYVNTAQIAQQNKLAVTSETLTTICDPRVVALSELGQILNTPIMDEFDDEEELEIEVELTEEDTPEETINDLKSVSDDAFEELDSTSMKDIEADLDAVFEKTQNLIEEVIEEDVSVEDYISNKLSELPNENVEESTEEEELSDALDAAFEKLLGEHEELAQEEDNDLVIPEIPTDIDQDASLSSD